MLINEVQNKDELSVLIINELKGLGVKCRKEKKIKAAQEKPGRKKIFRTHLHSLELTDVVLANGGIVQIPQFVSEACQRILEQVETDGLFRKAGSTLRQKEIRASLENGKQLGKSHHVIDVANVLKSFFRELPEPLLPPNLQETLLRSLLLINSKSYAILMSCLLLPPLTINTLAFFMQFLYTVSLSADQNRMSIENLAIIFTPGLMPPPSADIQGVRLNNHVKIIEFLIENSASIGVLPDKLISKLTPTMDTFKSTSDLTGDKKKKKRRSGSLTRMFNGFRKIVGAMGSSSENLDDSPEFNPATPCIAKSAKKRKIAESSAFSAKKKKELVDLLPLGVLLPSTPLNIKDTKKHRLSVGGRRNLKYPLGKTVPAEPAVVERRWSIVGSGWSRKKQVHQTGKEVMKPLSPVISMPCITDLKMDFDEFSALRNPFELSANSTDEKKSNETDYVRIHRSEYEAIKERVESIEKRISQEFGNLRTSQLSSSRSPTQLQLSGPEKVENKFERTCEETVDMESSPTTEKLAKRLSRELKIRRSTENRIIRSPSARKIGSIRRRSREAVRLSRNATWHISSTKENAKSSPENSDARNKIELPNGISFYPKANLKRGRPNTVQSGLQNRQIPPVEKSKPNDSKNIDVQENNRKVYEESNIQENWTSAEDFFRNKNTNICFKNHENNSQLFITPKSDDKKKSVTPKYVTTIAVNEHTKTPMLPPKSIPRRNNQTKTPVSNKSVESKKSNRFIMSPLDEAQNGRASIARLRTLNAGMVMAKAKLFDGLGGTDERIENDSQQSLKLKLHQLSPTEFGGILGQKADKNDNVKQKIYREKVQQLPKSPGLVHKRNQQQRYISIKNTNRNVFSNLLQNENVQLKSSSNPLKNVERTLFDSPKRRDLFTPRIKKPLKTNSPRLLRTPKEKSSNASRTPLKATPLAIRHSPRLRANYFDIILWNKAQ